MEEKILTSDQVAEILQIHPFTVLKFIKQGKLKASKLGRVYRIRSSDVDKFLDDQVNHKFKQEAEPVQAGPERSKSEPKAEAETDKTTTSAQKQKHANKENQKDGSTNPGSHDHYILQ